MVGAFSVFDRLSCFSFYFFLTITIALLYDERHSLEPFRKFCFLVFRPIPFIGYFG